MGGLSNIIDGIYSDDSDKEENGAEELHDSDTDAAESTENAPSLQQLADQMSVKDVDEEEISEETKFVTQDDVFETPAYDEGLPTAPTPPAAVSSQMIDRLKSIAPETSDEPSSSSDLTIAPVSEGLTTANSDDTESDLNSTRSLKATLGSITSEPSSENTVELIEVLVDDEADLLDDSRSHSTGSFIWTRDADDILPGRKGRR